MQELEALKRQIRFSESGSRRIPIFVLRQDERMMRAVLWGYFDEAGHFRGAGDYLCMAGYFGNDTHWEAFTKAWGELLRKYRIPGIHMKDMVALQGDYKDLGWDHAYRDKVVLPEFTKVIRDHLAVGLGVAVDLKYLRSMSKEAQKAINDPYYLCFMRMIRLIMDTMQGAEVDMPLSLIFDDSEEYSIRCYRMLTRLRKENPDVKKRVISISFGDDDYFYPLQAADVLAWETAKDLRQKAGGFNSREHFNHLVTSDEFGLQYNSHLYDQPSLDEIAATIIKRETGA